MQTIFIYDLPQHSHSACHTLPCRIQFAVFAGHFLNINAACLPESFTTSTFLPFTSSHSTTYMCDMPAGLAILIRAIARGESLPSAWFILTPSRSFFFSARVTKPQIRRGRRKKSTLQGTEVSLVWVCVYVRVCVCVCMADRIKNHFCWFQLCICLTRNIFAARSFFLSLFWVSFCSPYFL